MPMRMPEVKGTWSSPAQRMVWSGRRGACRANRGGRRPSRTAVGDAFEHDALRDGDFAEGGDLVAGHDPGVGMREQAGLFVDEPGHGDEVFDGGASSPLTSSSAGHLVAKLGLVAKGEECFAATLRGALPGDLEDFVLA
jgi:hypothetical protein